MTSMDSTPAAGCRTETMRQGRQAGSARRRQRVIAALTKAAADGTEISVSSIARAALLTELDLEFRQFSG